MGIGCIKAAFKYVLFSSKLRESRTWEATGPASAALTPAKAAGARLSEIKAVLREIMLWIFRRHYCSPARRRAASQDHAHHAWAYQETNSSVVLARNSLSP